MEYLSGEEIIAINSQIIDRANEGTKRVQYPEGLQIVVEQPQMIVFGHELYPNIWLKAAFILQKITKKHIFADGNKRTAYVSAKLFLMKNGYHLRVSPQEGVALMLGVTTREDTEQTMADVAWFLKTHCK